MKDDEITIKVKFSDLKVEKAPIRVLRNWYLLLLEKEEYEILCIIRDEIEKREKRK